MEHPENDTLDGVTKDILLAVDSIWHQHDDTFEVLQGMLSAARKLAGVASDEALLTDFITYQRDYANDLFDMMQVIWNDSDIIPDTEGCA